MAKKSTYFSDIEWVMTQGSNFKTKTNREHVSLVMNSSRVQAVIKQLVDDKARKLGHGPINYDKIHKEVEAEAVDICKVMFADYSMPMIRTFGWFLTKVFKQIYEKVVIDDTTLKRLLEHDQKKSGPLILMPTHRSYIDFLMVPSSNPSSAPTFSSRTSSSARI
jgi:glycerone phosphate O-acyltransferase/fatty acyl-CoA reductase